MKKIQLSVLTFVLGTNVLMAGGELLPITPYHVEDVKAAQVIPVTPVIEAPVAVVVAPVLANAEVSPFYVGMGVVAARYDSNCVTKPMDKTGGVVLRAGYDFNEYMGLEARGLISSYKEDGGKIKHLGGFLKPMYPISDTVNAYGLLGYAKSTTQGSLRRTDVSGLAFGAGLEYDFSEDKQKEAKYDREFDGKADQEKGFGVFADYERLYYKENSPDLDAVSVGITYDF
ncbi:MAG: Unknown protein [uncultured Sulfurovum sp.]|uniref:Outer membrane protein beta-barrel domain-containing protein n=1 Tax=uncultured Sulfurovum sp. TaxID=269237 RepID=A0A6S6SY10_9BACT|nr:MAG: Unknown protein [uncultured Sulfurovum sp.]